MYCIEATPFAGEYGTDISNGSITGAVLDVARWSSGRTCDSVVASSLPGRRALLRNNHSVRMFTIQCFCYPIRYVCSPTSTGVIRQVTKAKSGRTECTDKKTREQNSAFQQR